MAAVEATAGLPPGRTACVVAGVGWWPAAGHCGPCPDEAPNGEELGVSGRGPNGISGACEMTSGGGFCTGFPVLVVGLKVVVLVEELLDVGVLRVVDSLLLPKNFLKPPNQPDFFVVTSTSGSGVISISLL